MIETARLRLRPAVRGDLPAFHAILSDPEAMRYWSTAPHASLEQSERWLEAMIRATDERLSLDDLVLELDGELIGKAGFWRAPELGFILHPRHQGRGYAREALAALLERAFELHGLPRAIADVDPRNQRCLGLLARLNFRETGRAERTYRIGDCWSDSVYLELTDQRWRVAPAR